MRVPTPLKIWKRGSEVRRNTLLFELTKLFLFEGAEVVSTLPVELNDDRECPAQLFRFRSVNTGYFEKELRYLIERQEQRFSPVDSQNDPFDCNPLIVEATDRELLDFYRKIKKPYVVSEEVVKEEYPQESPLEIKRRLKRDFAVNFANVRGTRPARQEILKKYRNTTKAICLTESWDSPLHWAHYASGHNGIAIRFATDIDMAIAANDDLPLNIMYSSDRPKINELDILCWIEGLGAETSEEYSDAASRAFDAMNSSKSDH